MSAGRSVAERSRPPAAVERRPSGGRACRVGSPRPGHRHPASRSGRGEYARASRPGGEHPRTTGRRSDERRRFRPRSPRLTAQPRFPGVHPARRDRGATFSVMSADADRYERVTAVFTDRVAGCPHDRWSAPSPCDGWAARDVVCHVVDTHRCLLAGLDGREAEPLLTAADLEAARGGRPHLGRRHALRPGPGDATVGGRSGTMTLEQLTAAW